MGPGALGQPRLSGMECVTQEKKKVEGTQGPRNPGMELKPVVYRISRMMKIPENDIRTVITTNFANRVLNPGIGRQWTRTRLSSDVSAGTGKIDIEAAR